MRSIASSNQQRSSYDHKEHLKETSLPGKREEVANPVDRQMDQASHGGHTETLQDQAATQPLRPISEDILKSLPLFVPDGEGSPALSFQDSQMIAIQCKEGRKPAIVMSQELVDATIVTLEAAVESLYQRKLADVQKDIISERKEWTSRQQIILRREWRDLEDVAENMQGLDEYLRFADEYSRWIDAQTDDAIKTASDNHVSFAGHLYGVFQGHGMINIPDDRLKNIQPDEKFLQDFRIPEQEDSQVDEATQRHGEGFDNGSRASSPGRGRARDVNSMSHAADGRSRSSSPRRDRHRGRGRYRSRSPRRLRDASGSDSAQRDLSELHQARRRERLDSSRPPRQGASELGTEVTDQGWDSELGWPEEHPANRARRDLYARASEWDKALQEFEQRHDQPRRPEADGKVEMHEFERFVGLNRRQIEAEERFREARRRCQELGVEIPYNQTSSFAEDAGFDEEKVREYLLQFSGPDKFPKVNEWLENVVQVESDRTSADRDVDQASRMPTPEVSEEEARNVRNDLRPDDCLDSVAFGRGKERIRKVQMAADSMRDEAMAQWAQREGKSKADWDNSHWG